MDKIIPAELYLGVGPKAPHIETDRDYDYNYYGYTGYQYHPQVYGSSEVLWHEEGHAFVPSNTEDDLVTRNGASIKYQGPVDDLCVDGTYISTGTPDQAGGVIISHLIIGQVAMAMNPTCNRTPM